MILIYRFLTLILYPFLILFSYYRVIKSKEDPKRFKEKIFINSFNVKKKGEKSKLIWFHAASVGEVKSILPIITELEKNENNLEFLITTVTLSSGNLVSQEIRHFKNLQHRYFPFDINFLINKFIFLWKPDAVFLVDSEIWPNLIINLKKNKIPCAIINARITDKSFKRWMMFKHTARKIFNLLDLSLSSNKETMEYLEKLNAKNIKYTGNIKLINKINFANIKSVNEKILTSTKTGQL